MAIRLFIKDVASDDGAMKLLFDHLRNLGVCAAVIAAATWQFNRLGEATPARAIGYVNFGFLTVLGVWLYFVNQAHGLKKLREAGLPQGKILAIGQIHTLVAVTLIASLVIR